MKFPVQTKPVPENSEAIDVHLIVPPGDVPYYVEYVLDEADATIDIQLYYDKKEKRIAEDSREDVRIKYSETTGRVYRLKIENYSDSRHAANSAKRALASLLRMSDSQRYINNIRMAIRIVGKTLELAQQGPWDSLQN